MSEWDVSVGAEHLTAAVTAVTLARGEDAESWIEMVYLSGSALAEALPLAGLAAQLTHPRCKVWRAKVLGVEPLTREDGSSLGKANVLYESPPKWEDDPGESHTDWLSIPTARVTAGVAKSNIGEYCTFYQLNEPAPTEHKADSFRRLVWLSGPNPYVPPSKRHDDNEGEA